MTTPLKMPVSSPFLKECNISLLLHHQNLFTETIKLHLNSLYLKFMKVWINYVEEVGEITFQGMFSAESESLTWRWNDNNNKKILNVYQHLSLSLGPSLCLLFHESNESEEKKRTGMRDRCSGGVTKRKTTVLRFSLRLSRL